MSEVLELLSRLTVLPPKAAHATLDFFLEEFETVEKAAANYDWPLWSRPAQRIPQGEWSSYGFMTGRGWGKTASVVSYAVQEIAAGRARRIALVGQAEQKTIEILVTGETGLIALTPPWMKLEYEVSSNVVRFGNGATATIYTAHDPDGLRGPQHDLAIATELASWPHTMGDEAMSNLRLGLRLGRAQLLWDGTPKRRNALIRERLALAAKNPEKHVVVRGSTRENAINLAPDVVSEWEEQWGGTQRGREELGGEMLDDSEGSLVKSEWIERNRRSAPEHVVRRVIGIDPAVTKRAHSDLTGLVDVALAPDGKVLVLGDYSAKYTPEEWSAKALDKYFAGRCDLVIVETNKGGDLCVANLRANAGARGVTVTMLGKQERAPGHVPGVVHVRTVHGTGEKADRAQPLATAYERNRVCHVIGVPLEELETTLTTWEPVPGAKSPDRLDPLVYAVIELLGLADNSPDLRVGFKGLAEFGRMLTNTRPSSNLTRLLGGGGGGI